MQRMNPVPDAPIDEIREARHQISERHGHNPQNIVAYYIQMQQSFSSPEKINFEFPVVPNQADLEDEECKPPNGKLSAGK